jgi:SH3 domain-containing YSC84-like protein 1
MKMMNAVFTFFFIGSIMLLRADQTKTDVLDRLNSATSTLEQITSASDRGIPDEVLKGAKCIAVVPSMIKGAFIIGGKHGRGLSTCRLPNGIWSEPAFFTITGGSWGTQFGAEDVQLVMMVMTDDGVRHLLQDKFQIGAAASAAAGPVGRHASAGIDWKVDTEILTYSRSRGLFAGIDLSGSWIEQDNDSTIAAYGKQYTTREILSGHVPVLEGARPFLGEVQRVEGRARG